MGNAPTNFIPSSGSPLKPWASPLYFLATIQSSFHTFTGCLSFFAFRNICKMVLICIPHNVFKKRNFPNFAASLGIAKKKLSLRSVKRKSAFDP